MLVSSARPVVAGVSGSPSSTRAVEVAAREAAARGLPLRLVHTVTFRPGVVDQPGFAGDLLRRARAVATAVEPGLWISAELIEGHPVTGLLRLSRQSSLTVIGDGDLARHECLPRESTAVQVAARADGTVLVTRAAPTPDGPVIVGVDAASVSTPALEFAFAAAAPRHALLRLIHVGEVPDRAHVLTDVIRSRAMAYGIPARLDTLTGDPADVLRHESEEAALVVVGARGDRPHQRLLGSVAQTLLHQAGSPLAIIRRPRPHLRTRISARFARSGAAVARWA
ncbi:universal stress protein [Actinoplanes sp. NPDC049802]|uniref:universal stress protein n=1 Tax=Actinoplanes sp. NPDC049802 TaxID=3154742 RepID=UPI0033DEEE4B